MESSHHDPEVNIRLTAGLDKFFSDDHSTEELQSARAEVKSVEYDAVSEMGALSS